MSKGQNRTRRTAYQTGPGGVSLPGTIDNKANRDDLLSFLRAWFEDFEAWGQDIRDDIVRLEGRAGFPSGDPGDPPAGPF